MRMRSIAPLILLLGVSSTPAQESEPAGGAQATEAPIIIDSETTSYDMRAGVNRFEGNVTITRGPMRVDADQGVVRQADGRITEIELTGNPTTWLDRLEDGTQVEGEAQRIHFDVAQNVVTLSGSARLEHERGEYTGDELTYDLDTESLAGRATGEGNRVRVILEPENLSEGDGESSPAEEPAPDTPPQTPADETAADGAALAEAMPEAQEPDAEEEAAESVEPDDAEGSGETEDRASEQPPARR
jgi:lipopolysaccharide export system protein LptA